MVEINGRDCLRVLVNKLHMRLPQRVDGLAFLLISTGEDFYFDQSSSLPFSMAFIDSSCKVLLHCSTHSLATSTIDVASGT